MGTFYAEHRRACYTSIKIRRERLYGDTATNRYFPTFVLCLAKTVKSLLIIYVIIVLLLSSLLLLLLKRTEDMQAGTNKPPARHGPCARLKRRFPNDPGATRFTSSTVFEHR